jgi:hypothetical protein
MKYNIFGTYKIAVMTEISLKIVIKTIFVMQNILWEYLKTSKISKSVPNN